MTDGSRLSFSQTGTAVSFAVRARTRSGRDRIEGLRGDALVVATREVPDRGRANESIRRTLAGALEVPRSRVTLRSGHTGRDKRFQVEGMDATEFLKRMRPHLETADP